MAQGYCDKDCKKVTEGQSRGDSFQCGDCKKYTSKAKLIDNPDTRSSFVDKGYTAEYVVSSEKRVTTVEEVIELCKIDQTIWQVDKFEVGVHEGYRKDKKSTWEVKDGLATGKSEDSGKILVVPMHSVRVWVSRKTEEIRNRLVVQDFTEMAKKSAPSYPKTKYKKSTANHLFELGLPDLQLGRLVMSEETNGDEINPDIQIEEADRVVDELIGYAQHFGVERCLFPIGNDFFDTNGADMTTKHGTVMTDDARWKRTYQLGCRFLVRTIEKLMQVAPVDVLVIPGNHDEDKIWYLGEYLDAWFSKSEDVFVDNRMMKRKYYAYGKNLLGLTHGYWERNNKLDSLMAYEVPQLWAGSTHREWHLGDKHHKVDMILKTNELENGVVVRILRSLASPSVWEFDKGLVGSQKASEAFVWHEMGGIVAQFTSAK